jgi:fanconi-associated nuclease 1
MIFVLLMWDVIFQPIEGAFETPYQSAPLDFNTDAFAISRSAEIRARLSMIEQTDVCLSMLKETDDRERPQKTWAVGCRWDAFSQKDLLEIAECLGGPSLSVVCQIFCEEWEHCSSGLPDLCIWSHRNHAEEEEQEKVDEAASAALDGVHEVKTESRVKAKKIKNRVRFVEVKGPGDKLRENQILWIDLLLRANIEVEVAYVTEKKKP